MRSHFEPRWPVILTITGVIILIALLPGRLSLFPIWATYAAGVLVLAPTVAVGLTAAKARWLYVERMVILLFFVVMAMVNFANLANLVRAMIFRSGEVSGLQLLASSIAVWITNVLVFSLLYWQLDRGGPEARVNDANVRRDWLFPQEGAPTQGVPSRWQPNFVDYLFLGYSTATAFSTTDVMPLTSRAKILMMLESATSLAVIVVVGARAINILGS